MHAVVVAGGELPDSGTRSLVELCTAAHVVIAVDGGVGHCRRLGARPHVLIGDLDSASADDVAWARSRGTEVLTHPADKDATDLELALEHAVGRGATSLTVITPFGGRLDHELATIGLLASPRWRALDVCGVDGRRRLWVVRSSVALAEAVGTTISLVPWLDDAVGVTTAGLRWPLADETLPAGSTRGVSNVADAAQQHVAVESGMLLVIVDAFEEPAARRSAAGADAEATLADLDDA